MAEPVDAADSKSAGGNTMRVRVSLPASGEKNRENQAFLAGHPGVPGVGSSRGIPSQRGDRGQGAGEGAAIGAQYGHGRRRPVDRARDPGAGGSQHRRARRRGRFRASGGRRGLGDAARLRPGAGRLHDAGDGRHRVRETPARAPRLRARADRNGDGARRPQGTLRGARCRDHRLPDQAGRRARMPGALQEPADAAPPAARARGPAAPARAHGRGRDQGRARAGKGNAAAPCAGGRIPRRGDRLSPDPHVALLAPDRRGARPRARRGGDHRALRAAARHRQDRHPRPYPAEAGQARRRRVAGDAAPPRHRARDPEGQRLEVRAHGGPHRARPPRKVRGLGLSERSGRRPYPALRPHRRGGRRLRRADVGAALQGRLARGARLRIHHFTGRAAFRSAHGRCLSRHEVRGGADPAGVAGPADGALMAVLGEHYARLRARLAARPDTEHEQAIVRLLVGLALGLYLLPEILQRQAAGLAEQHILVWLGFLAASAGIFGAILAWPGESPWRRTFGAVLDISTLTWCLVHFEEQGAPLFLVYVWVTLANGFRFGARQLIVSLVASVAGFSFALWQSEFWQRHVGVGMGLLIGFILLSLYVRKLVTQLFDALARAEAANQAKRRFISVVSHEMRTPLNAIIGMSDLMRDTALTREQADMLQTLRSSSRVMLGLVEDVLDFSKIEAGKVTLEKADFDLHVLLNSTCRILAAQAAAKGVEFVVSLMPEVPPAVRGDPHYLRQILINLAGNAVKFTERGSVTVHVSAQSETEASVRLKFSIRDTGIGIPPEAQASIFESFAQADQSTTRRFGGTGLGTTIAKQLVGLMGGKIGLESAVGLGSTFWVELQLEKQPERVGAGTGELAGARILLVGFREAERAPLDRVLAGEGVTPVAVADVEEGVARLVAEISLAKPYHSAVLYGSGEDPKLAQRFRRAAPDPAPPTVLAVPRGADG